MTLDCPTILQIIPELDTGGAERSTIEIADAVKSAGGRALVVSQGGRLENELANAGGELIRLPVASKNPLTIRKNAQRIAALAHRERVDLLHVRSRAPAWSTWMASRRTGIPFISTYHGAYGESGRLKRLYNSVMVRGRRVIANSAYTAGLIRERYGTPADRIHIIPRGVDPEFHPSRITVERVMALRSAWGVTANERVILLAARLTGWKGQSILVDAVAHLAQRDALGNGVAILAGDHQGRDGYRERLLQQITGHGLQDRIRLVGHVEDMPAAFAAAHVTVVASTEPEAFGRSATEAQATGCPVIATRLGAPQETVLAPPDYETETQTGWLVAPGDPRDMAESIQAALSLRPDERQAIGKRASTHVHERFTSSRMKQETLRVYDELLGSRLEAAFRASLDTGNATESA